MLHFLAYQTSIGKRLLAGADSASMASAVVQKSRNVTNICSPISFVTLALSGNYLGKKPDIILFAFLMSEAWLAPLML